MICQNVLIQARLAQRHESAPTGAAATSPEPACAFSTRTLDTWRGCVTGASALNRPESDGTLSA